MTVTISLQVEAVHVDLAIYSDSDDNAWLNEIDSETAVDLTIYSDYDDNGWSIVTFNKTRDINDHSRKERKGRKAELSFVCKRIDKIHCTLINSEYAFHQINTKSDDTSIIAIKKIWYIGPTTIIIWKGLSSISHNY